MQDREGFMCRKFELTLVAIAVFLLAGEPASAQAPRNPVGVFHLLPPIMGLESATVRRELKLTEDQEQKAKAVLEKAREARKKVGRGGGGFARLPKEERQARLAELRKTLDAANDEATALLTDEQIARFNQIRIWIDPETSLFCEEIITELKLATAQTDALTAIFEKYRKKMLEIRAPADGTNEEKQRKMRDQTAGLREDAVAEYMGVLTKEQRDQFDRMRGPKFEVEISEFPTIIGDNSQK
jgi:Spy/CpxP family protein refolding chaperone